MISSPAELTRVCASLLFCERPIQMPTFSSLVAPYLSVFTNDMRRRCSSIDVGIARRFPCAAHCDTASA